MLRFIKSLFPQPHPKAKPIIKSEGEVLQSLVELIPPHLSKDDVVFFCIGTNQISGDCLGPLVGSYLKTNGYTNVYGTLQEPVDAGNIKEKIMEVPKGRFVIAIDAALGTFSYVESFSVSPGPLRPGAGIGKELPQIGDLGIFGVVNLKDWREDSQILFKTSLSIVIPMVITLSTALMRRFPMPHQRRVNIFEDDVEIRTYLKRLKGEYYSPLLS